MLDGAAPAPTVEDPGGVILAHNYYQRRGGEDQVFELELLALRARGHTVHEFVVDNDEIMAEGALSAAARAFYNPDPVRRLRELIRATGARLVHFHNTFPTMSPAVFRAARVEGAAVVVAVHNFRLFCIQGFFMRDGTLCTDCFRAPLATSGIRHRCYRGSMPASAVAATMIGTHWAVGTWQSAADRYIALTGFARSLLADGGLPLERISVKPNFIAPDPGLGPGAGGYALFVGRLSPEKGLDTLVTAWERERPGLPLYIVGEGPLGEAVAAAAARTGSIHALGFQSHDRVLELVGNASMLIVPSVGMENCPMVVVEAFARGTPVVASRLGPLPEIVRSDALGRLFAPGDPSDLARQVAALGALGADERAASRRACRREYETNFSVDSHDRRISEIYGEALCEKAGRPASWSNRSGLRRSGRRPGRSRSGPDPVVGERSSADASTERR